MDFITCQYCEGSYPADEVTTTVNGKRICGSCREIEFEKSVTIKFFEPGGIHEFLWTEIVGYMRKHTHEAVNGVPGIEGFHNNATPIASKGFTSILDNWIVEFNNPNRALLLSLMNKLSKRELIPPAPLVITIAQLGELRICINIITRAQDGEMITAWIKGSGQLRLS